MGVMLVAGLAWLALISTPIDQAQPDPAANQQAATKLEDITVQGRRIDERVRSFIDEVVAPPSGR